MEYKVVECDFIKRTLKIIEQYHELVMPSKPEKEQLEVTLLINCLTGLLVLPYEHQKRVQGSSTPNMCSNGGKKLTDLAENWGLSQLNITTFIDRGQTIQREDATLNQIVAMIRHSIAHSKFGDENTTRDSYGVSLKFVDLPNNTDSSEEGRLQSKITKVNFVNRYVERRRKGDIVTHFEATIPVEYLKIFATKLANSVLLEMGCNSNQPTESQ